MSAYLPCVCRCKCNDGESEKIKYGNYQKLEKIVQLNCATNSDRGKNLYNLLKDVMFGSH